MRSELIKEVNERFIKDTANHKIEILLDNGLYRHLKFSNNGSSVYRFDIVTWPGYLAVSGDMGEYVFSRISDMFEFFRNKGFSISTSYWAEKCKAAPDGWLKEYSADRAKALIKEQYEGYLEDRELSKSRRAELEEAYQDVLEKCDEESGPRAHMQLYDYVNENNDCDQGLPYLSDFWEYDLTEYRYHFIWILFAIVWGIQQYDKSKTQG